jgi:hypothetical protein
MSIVITDKALLEQLIQASGMGIEFEVIEGDEKVRVLGVWLTD